MRNYEFVTNRRFSPTLNTLRICRFVTLPRYCMVTQIATGPRRVCVMQLRRQLIRNEVLELTVVSVTDTFDRC